MNESKISVRYAKALFSTGKESQTLDTLKQDFEFLYQSIQEVAELQHIIQSPVIAAKEKIRLFDAAFGPYLSLQSMTFIRLVLENRREDYLEGMARYFLDLLRADQHIQAAEFTTATSIDEDIRKSLTGLITKKFDSKVDLKEFVDENIIGGFILRVGDTQIDASIATKLNRIRKELIYKQS